MQKEKKRTKRNTKRPQKTSIKDTQKKKKTKMLKLIILGDIKLSLVKVYYIR